MLEIGPKLLRFYIGHFFSKAIFACGLLRNKLHINKLLLLLLLTNMMQALRKCVLLA